MKKRLLALLLVIAMVMCMMPMAYAATTSGKCGENLTWSFDEATGILTIFGEGTMSNYDSEFIAEYFDYASTAPWYDWRESINSVIIEPGATTIGDYAFCECRNLTEVTIPEGITSIGENAFDNCESLAEVTIPESVTSIGEYSFNNCKSLAEVTIPESVTSIGEYSFNNCKSLTEITIPASVTSIGSGAFLNCTWVKSAGPIGGGYDYEFGWTESIPANAFQYCENLISVVIPDSVTVIGDSAFSCCENLTDVDLPNGVTSIGDGAFYGCFKLNNIEIPDTVTYIGSGAFQWCYALEDMTIPDSVTTIGYSAFEGCVNLRSVELSRNITAIFPETFAGTALSSIDIPEGVTEIGYAAFDCCSELTSISIPASVTDLGDWGGPFYACDSLTGIWVDKNNPSYCSDENGILFTKDKTALIKCPGGYVGECYIPETVTSVNEFAVAGCANLTNIRVAADNPNYANDSYGVLFNKEMTTLYYAPGQLTGEYIIPASVSIIYSYAFSRCQELTSAVIPEGVTTIEDRAFEDCPTLESIVIPASVNTIYPTSIFECPNLERFEVHSDNTIYSSDSSGVLFNKDKTFLIQAPGGISGDYVVPDTVTTIDDSAFDSCEKLTGIIMPSGLTKIGYSAFFDCFALDSIVFTGSAPEIAGNAFGYIDNYVIYSYDLEDIGHDSRVTATAYYPAGDDSWDDVIGIGKKITWVPYSGSITCFHRNTDVENDQGATCTATGYTGDTVCSDCGEVLEKGTVIPASGHTYKAKITAPTCTEKGYTTHTCACGDTYTDTEVPATGHSYGAWTQVKAPTTTQEGLEERKCACGEKEQRTIDKLPVPAPEFTDVVAGSFYEEAVAWAVAEGVTAGTSDTTFSPDADCTRAQVVTFLWRAAGSPAPTSENNPFADVVKDAYYYDAVLWAVEKGITQGVSATVFGTEQTCTRAQVATFLWRTAEKPAPGSAKNPFTDVAKGAYYYDAVLWAVENGITQGTSATTFSPDATCTRSQIVTFLYRFAG